MSDARLERLLLDAAMLVDEPAVGLVLGQRLVPGTHGPLGFAALPPGSDKNRRAN